MKKVISRLLTNRHPEGEARRISVGFCFLFLTLFSVSVLAAEHGGKNVQEHGGKKAKSFTASQIKSALRKHVVKESNAQGHMMIHDDQTHEDLALQFVKIHDPVRIMKKKGQYFACTDFHVAGQKQKIYDIDFWLEPSAGELRVVQTKVHKHPVQKKTEWVKEPRYTFEGEDIVDLP